MLTPFTIFTITLLSPFVLTALFSLFVSRLVSNLSKFLSSAILVHTTAYLYATFSLTISHLLFTNLSLHLYVFGNVRSIRAAFFLSRHRTHFTLSSPFALGTKSNIQVILRYFSVRDVVALLLVHVWISMVAVHFYFCGGQL